MAWIQIKLQLEFTNVVMLMIEIIYIIKKLDMFSFIFNNF